MANKTFLSEVSYMIRAVRQVADVSDVNRFNSLIGSRRHER